MRRKTWIILNWQGVADPQCGIELACPNCGQDAWMPTGKTSAAIVGAIGLGLIFDPPGHVPPPAFMPDRVKCRKCRSVFQAGA